METLGDHLTYLVNNILTSETYPDILKMCLLTPLYKGKGEETNVKNYRPITIVPTISKLIECIMSQEIMAHLDKNKVLADCQHAYRVGRSTTSAAHTFVDKVVTYLDKKQKVAGIFIDLSKAFDSVDHRLLVDKLKVYGIKGKSGNLVKSFLANRQQVVAIKCKGKSLKSNPLKPKIGIPQGSSLGNTMFITFTNDIAHLKLKGELIQYADDTTVIVSGKNLDDLKENISHNMKVLCDWFDMNGLKLNADKTNIVLFNAVSPKQPNLLIHTTQMPEPFKTSSIVKLLGFELDSALSWKTHINTTCNKMSKGIYAMIQLRPIASESYLKEIYYAYIHSVMIYGIILWGYSTDNERILKMQKRAIRVLTKAKYRDSCRSLFQSLGILTSTSVYIYEIVKYVRVNLEMYKTRGDIINGNFRHKEKLLVVQHRLHKSMKNPKIIGQQLYNKLPKCIKECAKYNMFCFNVKQLLLSKTLYTVDEFIKNDYSSFNLQNDYMT